MVSSTDKNCFAKPSATMFLLRQIQTKETNSKELAREIISAATSYSSEFAISDFKILINVAESNSNLSLGRLRSLHIRRASRTARPSAMRGEFTWVAGIAEEEVAAGLSIVHPSPASCEFSCHAASVLTTTSTSTSGGAMAMFFFCAGFSWHWAHSRAAVVALVMTSIAEHLLSSKSRVFRSIQSCHKIQGAKGQSVRPVGGRFFFVRRATQSDLKYINPLYSKLGERGVLFHTCWAKLQWRNRWSIDSGKPQVLHFPSTAICLAMSWSPIGKAPWKSFHKNSFIFGAVWMFHTFLFQSKALACGFGGISNVVSTMLARPLLYPDFCCKFSCFVVDPYKLVRST